MIKQVVGTNLKYLSSSNNGFLIGCYKSAELIGPLGSLNRKGGLPKGVKIKAYIYSEAGAGKSKCDQVIILVARII